MNEFLFVIRSVGTGGTGCAVNKNCKRIDVYDHEERFGCPD